MTNATSRPKRALLLVLFGAVLCAATTAARSAETIGALTYDSLVLTGDVFTLTDGEGLAVTFQRIVAADDDGDGVNNRDDNCTLAANADQLDTDGDNFGNACDIGGGR